MALLTGDTDFPVYTGGRNPSPTPHLRGGDAPAPMFDELSFYEATMHFSGQSTTVLDASQTSGVADWPAHHVEVDGWTRSFIVAAIGYLDSFVTQGAAWFLSRRKLMVDWTETCLLATG